MPCGMPDHTDALAAVEKQVEAPNEVPELLVELADGAMAGLGISRERCVASVPNRDRARPFGAAAWSCLLGPSMGLSLVCPRATLDVTMRAIALAVLSLFTFSASAETATTCKAQADEKKLAGADLKSFTTKGERDAKPA